MSKLSLMTRPTPSAAWQPRVAALLVMLPIALAARVFADEPTASAPAARKALSVATVEVADGAHPGSA